MPSHKFIASLGACAALLCPSCLSSELDLSKIKQPVLMGKPVTLGNHPIEASVSSSYEGKTYEAYGIGGNIWDRWTTRDAQALAFEKVGGTQDFIGNVTIDVGGYGINIGLMLGEQLSIEVEVDALEVLR